MACRLPSFVSIHAHIITKRTKITNDLKFKKMKEIWIMLSGACIWLENIYDMAMQLKLKRAWKIEMSLR